MKTFASMGLLREISTWEITKQLRGVQERKFVNFTGLVDVHEYHMPYTRYELLERAIGKSAKYKGSKILVSAGDSVNMDTYSKFHSRSTCDTAPEEEIECLVRYLKHASKVYDKVIFLTTNHENRIKKIIQDSIKDSSVSRAVLKQVRFLDTIFSGNNLDKVIYVNDYVFKVGRLWVTHLENNSAVPGRIGEKVKDGLNCDYGRDWDVCIQAHTHCQSNVTFPRQTVIESGTFMSAPDYWVKSGKIKGERKSTSYGYAWCEMVNGVPMEYDYRIMGWRENL